MADAKYEEFLPQVLPYAVGVPEPFAVNAVRNAAIEFLRGTHFLQQDIDPIPVVPNIFEYDLDVPTGYSLITVRSLYLDNSRLSPVSELQLRQLRRMSTKAKPHSYYLRYDYTMILYPTPDKTGTLTGTISYAPTVTSKVVDRVVHEQYLEPIAAGALARLLLTPDEPYSNPEKAMYYRKRFENGMADAKSRKNVSLVGAPVQIHLKGW